MELCSSSQLRYLLVMCFTWNNEYGLSGVACVVIYVCMCGDIFIPVCGVACVVIYVCLCGDIFIHVCGVARVAIYLCLSANIVKP